MTSLNFDTKNKTKHQLIEAGYYSDNNSDNKFEHTESRYNNRGMSSSNMAVTLGSMACILITLFILFIFTFCFGFCRQS